MFQGCFRSSTRLPAQYGLAVIKAVDDGLALLEFDILMVAWSPIVILPRPHSQHPEDSLVLFHHRKSITESAVGRRAFDESCSLQRVMASAIRSPQTMSSYEYGIAVFARRGHIDLTQLRSK